MISANEKNETGFVVTDSMCERVCVFPLADWVRFIKESCWKGLTFKQTDLNETRGESCERP